MQHPEGSPDAVVVQGQVVLPPGDRPDEAARLVVRVEDVSQADAPSVTVAQSVLERVRLPRDGDSLPFEVSVPRQVLDPKRHYSVRIHLDVAGTGTVTTGDFLSTQSHPLAVPPVPSAPPVPADPSAPAPAASATLDDPVIRVRRI